MVIIGLESESGRGKFAPHCVGARFLDYLVSLYHRSPTAPWEKSNGFESCSITIDGHEHLLIKPLCQYNDCGSIIVPHLNMFVPEEIIVIHDELMLPLGSYQFRESLDGSSGNRGVINFVAAIGTDLLPSGAIGVQSNERDIDTASLNQELPENDRDAVRSSFPALLESITQYAHQGPQSYPANLRIPADVARQSQLVGRTVTHPLSPVRIVINKDEAYKLNKAIDSLARIISSTAGRYAQAVHDEKFSEPLIQLLEFGIPKEMIPLIRSTKAHIQHMSFDFRGGKLIEINAAPLPPIVASRSRDLLDIPGPGKSLDIQSLCEIPERLGVRAKKQGKKGKVLLVSHVGGNETGGSWYCAAADYLRKQGLEAVVGTTDDHPDADVVFANMTWMTPDRWPSVVTEATQEGIAKIFPSPRNFLFTSKRFLALLGSRAARKILGIEEGNDTQRLREILLYSTDLDEGSGFIDFAISKGHRLYGKPYLSSGGRGGGAIAHVSDLRHIERPAVVQEWTNPCIVEGTDLQYELRVVVYGSQGEKRIWEGLVWRSGEKLNAPLIAPVTYR